MWFLRAIGGIIIGSLVFAAVIYTDAAGNAEDVPDTETDAEALVAVTVIPAMRTQETLTQYFGTIHVRDAVDIVPSVNGQVRATHVDDGDEVAAGEILAEFTGVGGIPHPSEAQLAIADAQYRAAEEHVEQTIIANAESIRAAELQIAAAEQQAAAADLERQAAEFTILQTLSDAALLDNSLRATTYRNDLEYEKQRIEIRSLEDQLDQSRADYRDDRRNADDATLRTLKRQYDVEQEVLENSIEKARIELESLDASSAVTENQLASQLQDAQHRAASLELTRQSALHRSGLSSNPPHPIQIAQTQLQAVIAQNNSLLTQAQSGFEIARINLDAARLQVDLLTLRAPTNGTVDDFSLDVGSTVSPVVTVGRIVSSNGYEVAVPVPTEDAAGVETGMPAKVIVDDIVLPGVIERIAPAADAQTGFVTVIVMLTAEEVWDGDTVQVILPIRRKAYQGRPDMVVVPLDAVTIGTQEQYVFIVEDEHAVRREVLLGSVRGDLVEIREGVTEGDLIIVDGARTVLEGARVTVDHERT